MLSNAIGLRILVRGNPINEYSHERQTFVEGRQGTPYEIEIVNQRGARIAVVLSVDGLSVMDGQPAGPNSGAYILNPWEKLCVPGWKLSGNQEAAKFVFGGTSYAEQTTGSARNNGVIGAIFYAEKVHPVRVETPYVPPYDHSEPWMPPVRPWRPYDPTPWMPPVRPWRHGIQITASQASAKTSLNSFMRGQSKSAASNIGTGFGDATEFRTQTIQFERGMEIERRTIYYDDARGLRRRGIDVRGPVAIPQAPNPFPADGCKPPPGWQEQRRRKQMT